MFSGDGCGDAGPRWICFRRISARIVRKPICIGYSSRTGQCIHEILLLEEYGKLAIADMPRPEPGEHEVLVRVAACGICGSDVHGYDGSSGRRIPPLVMGHEASGVIVGRWAARERITSPAIASPSTRRSIAGSASTAAAAK